jgi:hypothetical protein
MATGNNSKNSLRELAALPSAVARGLKVLASELKWQLVQIIRGLEIRQMKKRLMREYQTLGEITYARMLKAGETEPMPPPDKRMIVSAKQIDFLLDEMEHLRAESGKMRDELVQSRSKDLGYE